MRHWSIIAMVTLLMPGPAKAQSSSLYMQEATPPKPRLSAGGWVNRLAPTIGRDSFTAVSMPEPRKFAVHDLVTIIVRESTQTDVTAELETEKEADVKGKISAFPRLTLSDLLDLQLRDNVISDPPEVGVKFEQDFEGSGDYKRKDTFVSRITARIIDVKPNGTLVLEAKKYIQSDKETLQMSMTGTCRKDDVRADNTVLSTQLADLHIVKSHDGEVRKSTKKGFLTKLLELIFNF